MAKRRMFNIDLMTSDKVLRLSPRAQLLYLQLNLHADDDGLVGNSMGIIRILNIPKKILTELEDEGFLIIFESGVVAITHWFIHNQIRRDRYSETRYFEELSQLTIEKGRYVLIENSAKEPTEAQFFGNHLATQVSVEEYSPEKERLEQFSLEKDSSAERSEG
jgi:hypothetical protein